MRADEDKSVTANYTLGENLDEPSKLPQTDSREAVTAQMVERFSTYPLQFLLDELVVCTVRWNLGDVKGAEDRIATALLARLASLGLARKEHREGCLIWPQHSLCKCPWVVPL